MTCRPWKDTVTKLDYIVAVGGNQASVTSNSGSGVNPDILVALNDPEPRTIWMGEVDGGSVGAAGLTSLVGYLDPLTPGFLMVFGELLVDPGSPSAVLNASALFGGMAAHDFSVANDVALIGFSFCGQVLLNNVGGTGQLTNRLDFVLGLWGELDLRQIAISGGPVIGAPDRAPVGPAARRTSRCR